MMEANADYEIDSWKYRFGDGISIQIIDNVKLDGIDEKVLKYVRHFESAPDWPLRKDEIVIAICSAWNKWFRARILSHNEKMQIVKVLAIDYGREFELPTRCVFPLHDAELKRTEPVRPIQVEIHGIKQTKQGGWANNVQIEVETFINFASKTIFRCMEVRGDCCVGDIVIPSKNKCLSDMLVDLGFAAYTESVPCEIATSDDDSDSGCAVKSPEHSPRKEETLEALSESTDSSGSTVVENCDDEFLDGLSDDGTIENVETESLDAMDGYETDASRRKIFDFDDVSEYQSSECTIEDISHLQSIKRQLFQMRQLEQNAIPNNAEPLAALPMKNTRLMLIGGESAGSDCDISKCYDEFLPNITEELKQLPQTNRLQELAWPHLLKGGSAIIIDTSDHLADLVYLPVVCTQVEKVKENRKRSGPLAIIICKNQDRCVDIAKRCLRFSPAGYMANHTICISNENQWFVANTSFKNCKIFVTSIMFFIRFGLSRLDICNSVQKIVFDGMDRIDQAYFQQIISRIKPAPQQIIVTSKLWRPVHRGIYNNNRSKDYAIIGAPLDIAIAANTRFDFIFADRAKMSQPTSHEYKLFLILGNILIMQMNSIIICQGDSDLAKLAEALNKSGISITSFRVQQNQSEGNSNAIIAEYYRFVYAGKNVTFCAASLLPSMDLSNISHYFIFEFGTNLDRPEMHGMNEKFQSIIRPNTKKYQLPMPVTITMFTYDDGLAQVRELAESFLGYQRFMHCPKFWSKIASENVLPFAHDLCLEFRLYFNGEHRNNCRKRHQLLEEDEAQLCNGNDLIQFRILHFFSPVHYKVELFDNSGPGGDSSSRSRIVEIHLSKILPNDNYKNPWTPEVFQSIFDRLNDPDERFECYSAKPIIKLREIIFVDHMRLWPNHNNQTARDQSNGITFVNDPRSNLIYSPGVISKCLNFHKKMP